VLAHERGLQVTRTKGLQTGDYTQLVSCQVTTEGGEERLIAGTLFDGQEPRIVQIDQYRTDFIPQGHLLVMGSYDRPGVIGQVGSLLAAHDINIASWRTGRTEPGGHTLTVISLDDLLPDALLDDLRRQEFVRHALQIRI
jgi:D-3-phosphoglycerate dehydrogenase